MDRKKIILLAAALLIAGITAFMAKSMFTGASAPKARAAAAPKLDGPKVLVATKSLPVGTIITAEALRYQPWPKEMVEEAYFTSDGPSGATPNPAGYALPPSAKPAAAVKGAPGSEGPKGMDDLIGTVVRQPITAGQPITRGSLVYPGDRGFLAAALSPGMRAVTVPVSALTGVAGFIFPGDRVDLVLTQNVTGTDGPALKVSETIMRNLRVLATDQRASSSVNKAGKTVVAKYKLVTLEATPRLAEKITVAQTIGTITLSLRALADNAAELEQALASGQVSIPPGTSPEDEEKILKSIAQHPTSGKSTFATGGDVSRFQRSSIPPQTAIGQAVAQTKVQIAVAKATRDIRKAAEDPAGPVVNVSRGGNAATAVPVDRR
jgi:pilus assembly protein CpaB